MRVANPLWGAPRIHGELLKLGIDVGQTTVAKYMSRRRTPPSQGWKTFLRNHADGSASMDLFLVPTISFRLLNTSVASFCGWVYPCGEIEVVRLSTKVGGRSTLATPQVRTLRSVGMLPMCNLPPERHPPR
jgi:hypothetical protein